MNFKPSFDPEMNTISIGLQVRFLDKYYDCLKEMIKTGSQRLPKSVRLRKTGKNEVEISFPLPNTSETKKIDENIMSIAVDDRSGHISNLHKLINEFINSGIKNEFKTHEFLPLKNYPKEDFIKDALESAKQKRNMIIIADYNEYLRSQNEKDVSKIRYTQYIIEYGTNEWSDCLLEFMDPNFDLNDFGKRYLPKCKLVDWI